MRARRRKNCRKLISADRLMREGARRAATQDGIAEAARIGGIDRIEVEWLADVRSGRHRDIGTRNYSDLLRRREPRLPMHLNHPLVNDLFR